MNNILDDLAREIARGTSRRDILRSLIGAFLGLFASIIGVKTAKGASLTPICGTCQACELSTNTCGMTCNPATTAQTLCSMASRDGSYLRLAYYLTTNGFTSTGVSDSLLLYNSGQLVGSALATNLTNTGVTGQTAIIQYVMDPQGNITPAAFVFQSGTAIYALSVDPSGRIVKTIATQTTTTSSGVAANALSRPETGRPAHANNATHEFKSETSPLAISPDLCGHLVDYLCGTGGGLACFGAGLLVCPETGPGVIACGLLVTVICGGIAIYGCDVVKTKTCGCPPNQQNCNGVCCGPCMDCLNGTCVPNITCGSGIACCNSVCCAPGLVCSNNVCTSPNAGCVGATCETFVPCSTNSDCVCVTISAGGGLCVPGSTSCGGLAICDSAPCPEGTLCAIGTCCGDSVCIPISLQCAPLTSAASPRLAAANGPTIGHR